MIGMKSVHLLVFPQSISENLLIFLQFSNMTVITAWEARVRCCLLLLGFCLVCFCPFVLFVVVFGFFPSRAHIGWTIGNFFHVYYILFQRNLWLQQSFLVLLSLLDSICEAIYSVKYKWKYIRAAAHTAAAQSTLVDLFSKG